MRLNLWVFWLSGLYAWSDYRRYSGFPMVTGGGGYTLLVKGVSGIISGNISKFFPLR